jgi:MoCo/4Fe-4S cofactor protein with predicted Tat translocation signal
VSEGERVYWKSLDELRRDSRAQAERRREFQEPLPAAGAPAQEAGAHNGRRDFLTLMGFSLGAATLGSCARAPERKALPFVSQPEETTPGVASWYASTCGGCSAACSLLVKTRDGRPIKVEGNPDSALFGGGTCAVGQATVLSLYDEERLRGPLWRGQPTSWSEVDAEVQPRLEAAMARGHRVVLLSGPLPGPSTRELLAQWKRTYPRFEHVVYEPRSQAALRRAHQECFGRAVVPHYRFEAAALVVGLEADFLGTWLSPVEFTRQYARRRAPEGEMARHVQFESGLSLTGANADRRHAVSPSQLGAVALALLRRVQAAAGHPAPPGEDSVPVAPAVLDALAADLWRHRGASLVVSAAADPALQVLVAALNHHLGNYGPTIDLARSSLQAQADDAALAALVEDMHRGEVQVLLLHGVNPAYDYEDASRFADAMERVALTVSLGERLDETAARAHAVCPDHHFLESWGDAEPVASSLSLRQPAVAPLFDTRSAQDSLLKWMGQAADYHTFLRETWRRSVHPRAVGSAAGRPGFDLFWDQALERGLVELPAADEALPPFRGPLDDAVAEVRAAQRAAALTRGPDTFELHLYESVGLRDGRHANNPWLQELPDPITKVTWGNAACLAPAAAERLGLGDGDVVELSDGMVRVQLPVCVQPGQEAGTVSVALGYGRRQAGKVGSGVGAGAFAFARLQGGVRRHALPAVSLRATGRTRPLAATQTHHSMEGRPLVREAAWPAYRADARAALGAPAEEPRSLWAPTAKGAHTWGLAIDLSSCTGCSACVVACQAENNVAVVGADEVRRGREMHWIRIDRYYSGEANAPDTSFQPVMCQHCHDAPCETVCPVVATVHSAEGLNQQVYNRCIGTRYCENNCPYKVRRFNWFNYTSGPRAGFPLSSALGTMVLNPDVVVRSRGVMEKCSLCVQRIQAGKLEARLAGRPLADGGVQTACQQACPAQAIVFGDLDDAGSRVAGLSRGPRAYHLLEQLGTRPGVGYLAKIRNREA